ncbi:hypothetical protein K474DRAFT_1664561 [Panus rudis PR-1116 ss-1]|nr:hypothetical protein K474DRAFT_1664561 [Panus rudis PR-1116 ss-1]
MRTRFCLPAPLLQLMPISDRFSSILISRFLLDLRSVSSSAPDNLTNWNSSSSPEDAVLSSVRFASVVAGDIGAPSDHSTWLSNATTEYDDCGDDERHEQDEREQYQNPTLHEHGGARPTLCQDLELQERESPLSCHIARR